MGCVDGVWMDWATTTISKHRNKQSDEDEAAAALLQCVLCVCAIFDRVVFVLLMLKRR